MFTTKEQLEKKTGPYGIGRLNYLQSLVTEFEDTEITEAKEEVLGNLANFAYDPVNYEYMRQLNIVDLFLDCLGEENDKLAEFAIAGLCNLALDKDNQKHIIKNGGIGSIKGLLSRKCEESVISAITCLLFLVNPESKSEITSMPIVEAMLRFAASSKTRLSNLAVIFLEDVCSPERVNEAKQLQQRWQESGPT